MNMLTYDWQHAVRHIAAADPKLGRVIKAAGPVQLEIKRYRSPYEYLLRAIIFQQLAGKAATTIHGRLLDLFPARRPKPELLLKMSVPKLRKAGVSANKQKAIKDLAHKTAGGRVPTFAKLSRMEDEEIVERLTQVHGIGRWTVEMLLMFQLGRPDVLPINDLGVQKGFAKAYGMVQPPKPKELQSLAESWRPYRSVGSWLCWRALDL